MAAETLLTTLKKTMNDKGIFFFDNAIDDVLATIRMLSQQVSTSMPSNDDTNTKNLTEAEKLLVAGQFAEAKRKFASEGNSEMAQACSKLIRAKRSIASYASGLDSVRRSRNVTSKQNAIKELENSLALYRQYGLVTKEIEQLIERYKSI